MIVPLIQKGINNTSRYDQTEWQKKQKNTRAQMILHHLRPSFSFGWWRGKAEGGFT